MNTQSEANERAGLGEKLHQRRIKEINVNDEWFGSEIIIKFNYKVHGIPRTEMNK